MEERQTVDKGALYAALIIEWGNQLVNWVSGEDVLSEIKEFKTAKDTKLTLSSLSTTVSHVRKTVIDSIPQFHT